MGYEGEGGLFGGDWEADLDLRHCCEIFVFEMLVRMEFSIRLTGQMMGIAGMLWWHTYVCSLTADSYLVGREDGLAWLRSAVCSNSRE